MHPVSWWPVGPEAVAVAATDGEDGRTPLGNHQFSLAQH